MINRIFILFVLQLVIFSCMVKNQICFDKENDVDSKLFNNLIDTNSIYILKYTENINEINSLSVKYNNLLIKEKMPCIRFSDNGTYKYYHDLVSYKNSKIPIYGRYRLSNDTLKICQKYYSAQSGKYYSTSIMIIKDSILEEKNYPKENGITKFYARQKG